MTTHSADIDWQRRDQSFLDGRYSRAFTFHFDGGVSLPGSAAPSVVRPPLSREDAADPEELLVASVSACHMLFFLDLARRAGLTVDHYHDAAIGTLGRNAEGLLAITKVTLRPTVRWAGEAGPPSAALLAELHHKAHEACFIARSLRCEVDVAPQE